MQVVGLFDAIYVLHMECWDISIRYTQVIITKIVT